MLDTISMQEGGDKKAILDDFYSDFLSRIVFSILSLDSWNFNF